MRNKIKSVLEAGSILTKGQRLVPNVALPIKHREQTVLVCRARPELAVECPLPAVIGAQWVWHHCGPVLLGSLCLWVFSVCLFCPTDRE